MLLTSDEINSFLLDGGIVADFNGLQAGVVFFFNTKRLHGTTSFEVMAEENDFMAIIETVFALNNCVKGTLFSTQDNAFKYYWGILKDPEDMMNGYTKLILAGNGKDLL